MNTQELITNAEVESKIITFLTETQEEVRRRLEDKTLCKTDYMFVRAEIELDISGDAQPLRLVSTGCLNDKGVVTVCEECGQPTPKDNTVGYFVVLGDEGIIKYAKNTVEWIMNEQVEVQTFRGKCTFGAVKSFKIYCTFKEEALRCLKSFEIEFRYATRQEDFVALGMEDKK